MQPNPFKGITSTLYVPAAATLNDKGAVTFNAVP